jgi:hypothetical protein
MQSGCAVTTIEIRDVTTGESLAETEGCQLPEALRRCASAWADRNGFSRLVFWREGPNGSKLWIQFDAVRLNYWIPDHIVFSAQLKSLEEQLDYALGAHHRNAAGFVNFDH